MTNLKKKIRNVGMVYPCKKCGAYPVWGSCFLLCENSCYETSYDDPKGSAVREWNMINGPKKSAKEILDKLGWPGASEEQGNVNLVVNLKKVENG